MVDTNELLQRFVAGNSDPREWLRTPILRAGWIYATNGHIVVRVPYQAGIEASESDKPPYLGELFDWHKPGAHVPLPDLPVPEKCPGCGGSSFAYKCIDCDGEGSFDHGQHEYVCKSCQGEGQTDQGDDADKITCRACYGSGIKRFQPMQIGDISYDLRYLSLIANLPDLKFAPGASAAYFSFDGGEGVLMPMRV